MRSRWKYASEHSLACLSISLAIQKPRWIYGLIRLERLAGPGRRGGDMCRSANGGLGKGARRAIAMLPSLCALGRRAPIPQERGTIPADEALCVQRATRSALLAPVNRRRAAGEAEVIDAHHMASSSQLSLATTSSASSSRLSSAGLDQRMRESVSTQITHTINVVEKAARFSVKRVSGVREMVVTKYVIKVCLGVAGDKPRLEWQV